MMMVIIRRRCRRHYKLHSRPHITAINLRKIVYKPNEVVRRLAAVVVTSFIFVHQSVIINGNTISFGVHFNVGHWK